MQFTFGPTSCVVGEVSVGDLLDIFGQAFEVRSHDIAFHQRLEEGK